MQRLQDALTDGYERYQKIECDQAKAVTLAKQFAAAYETEISKQSRWRRRRSGLATAKLVSLKEEGSEDVTAFLMVSTEGKGLVERERLLSAREKRIVLGEYELVHDGVSWSWQYTAKAMISWRKRIRAAIAKDDTEERLKLTRILYFSAGFRLVRKQVGELANVIRGDWRRLRRGAPPELPTYLEYIKRLPDDWTPSSRPTPSGLVRNLQ